MELSKLIALYDQDQRRAVEYATTRREVTPRVVRHLDTTSPRTGAIIYSDLDESNVEETIREEVRFFESLGRTLEWKVYDHDRPADLKDRLERYGFKIEEVEAIMVLDLEEAPSLLWEPVGGDVRRITDPQDLPDVFSVQQQVWDEDFSWLENNLGRSLQEHPDQTSVYVAYVDARPACSAWVFLPRHSQFASLWGGSTVSEFRKRGLYTALLAARAQEARARGRRFLTVDASEMSRPIQERFGFVRIAWSWPCKWGEEER